MITKVIMPKLGMVMKEGLVVHWHVEEGERVEAGKLLLEIESDKVTTEIEAPVSGVVRKIIVMIPPALMKSALSYLPGDISRALT